ncbi:AAA family ATPase [Haloarcula laminariae]|uniref:AAA family ATPase n=1 Tax=Haloarcula laminariae TaxID=2961577 RepID=UPI0024049E8B|nr:AAA family ATPase [Halomicroarcula sp. FL173]
MLASSALDRTEDVCLFGPSGAGKTTVAKYMLSELEREMLGMRWGYVNSMADSTHAAELHKLVREIGLGADLRREGHRHRRLSTDSGRVTSKLWRFSTRWRYL